MSRRRVTPAAPACRLPAHAAFALALLLAPVAADAAVTQSAPSASVAPDQPDDVLVPPTSASDFTSSRLDGVLEGAWRSPASRARDRYRHPKQTLQFFGVRPDQTIIEVTPGGGWYSEILAPLLHDNGHYVAAVPKSAAIAEAGHDDDALHRKFAGDAAHYGNAQFVAFEPQAPVLGAPGSADVVLTFRNVHNWVMAGTAPAMFRAFFAVLKPGGVLGVVEHRADDDAPAAPAATRQSGYQPVRAVIKLATDAGFALQQSSEINANAKDVKNYPRGVWTLPPTLALGEQDKAKYLAIGESDRMTLRFVKPPLPPAAASTP